MKIQKDSLHNIADLLPDALKESLSESSLKLLQDEFTNCIEAKVNERVKLAVEAAEANFDNEAIANVKKLVEAKDNTTKKQIVQVVNALNESYSKKINELKTKHKAIVESLKQKTNKDAKEFKVNLIESINAYFNDAFARLLPVKTLKEAAHNAIARDVLGKIKNVLNVTDETAQAAVKEPLDEAKKQVKIARMNNIKLREDNTLLKEELENIKLDSALNEKVSTLSPDKRKFVQRLMENSSESRKFVNENFDYVVSLYENKILDEKKVLTEQAKSKMKKLPQVPRKVLVTETRVNKPKAPVKKIVESQTDKLINLIKESAESDNY